MDNKRTKFIIKIAIAIVIGIIIMAGRCSQSKAEGERGFATQEPTNTPTPAPTQIFFTPDPNGSWDDYISAHPILTPAPYVPDTEEPSPSPSEVPMMATNPVSTARFTAYRYCPEVQDGGVIDYLYQKLLPNYNLYTSPQGNHTVPYTTTNNWYQWDASSVPNGKFQINENDGILNLYDTYILGYWNIYFSSGISLNSGLDYGTECVARVKWNIDVIDNDTGLLTNSFPVLAIPYVMLDNGLYLQLEPIQSNVNLLRQGIEFKIKQDYQNRKIYRITLGVYVGCTLDMYNNTMAPGSKDVVKTYTCYSHYLESPFTCACYVNTSPAWSVGDKIFSFIQTIPGAIGSAIQGLFLPTSNDLNAWVQSHLSSSLESGSPVNRYWEFYLALCNKFINPTYNLDPYLVMPSFSFNVNGQKQTIWQEQRFRLKDADIPFSDGTTLFYWVRLATSIIIVSHWIGNFAYTIFQRAYHIYESAPSPEHEFEGGGGESRGGGVGRK